MTSEKTFGQYIRELRERQKLPLRKVAAFLDMDQSTLGKIERGERKANLEMVSHLSAFLDVNEKEMRVVYFSDKVAYDLWEEDWSGEILKVAEKKIEYMRSRRQEDADVNSDSKNTIK